MDHVELVLGLEMSRLSRSCRDWHHLLEVCGLFGALLADQDGRYDPSDPDDRLVLGLKGQLSEMELHIIRSRLERGKLNKARRGELLTNAPIGYVKTPAGGLSPDPNEQVRRVVLPVFDKFDELGTAHAVTHYLRGPTAASWAFGGGATTRARLGRHREGLPSEGRDPGVGSRRSSGEVRRSALVRRASRPGIM